MPIQPSPTVPGTSNLTAIQTKVRRLTRSLSENQLSTTDLNNYIDTFVIYDFPEQLRTFNLRTTFTWYCNAFQDVYPTDTSSSVPNQLYGNQTLYNFQNLYISVHPPMYIAGFPAYYTQSPQEFWNVWPFVNSISPSGQYGDGSTTKFSGVVNTAQTQVPPATQQIVLAKNNVLFSSVDSNGNGLAMIDTPISNTLGNLGVPGVGPTSTVTQDMNNYINYLTGSYTVTFATAPAAGVNIDTQTLFLSPSRPQSILYYANAFTLRPIPDQPYAIDMEVYQRPTSLLNTALNPNGLPELEEWWQYISYGAAIKILQDRMDLESVQLLIPEFKVQENLINRRTIVQYTNERASTIYTEFNNNNGGWGFWGNSGNGGQ